MLDNIKKIMSYVVLPLTILFGFIYYLLTRISSLQSQVNRNTAEKELSKTLTSMGDAKHVADEKEEEFNNDYSDFRRSLLEYSKGSGDVPDDSK